MSAGCGEERTMARIVLYSDSEFWNPLRFFAKEMGLPLQAIAKEPLALAPDRPLYYEVYDASRFKALEINNKIILGEFIGILVPRRAFKPSLPLAGRLAPKCGILKCIKISYNGEKYFLYGKSVMENNVEEWHPGTRIVVNPLREPLGWGIGRIVKRGARRERLVVPLWDLGWYLRRGG